MIIAISILLGIGLILGLLLGIASHFLQIDEDPLENEIKQTLPGSNCGQCGFVGCALAAKALAEGKAKPTICLPGGRSVAAELAKKLGSKLDESELKNSEPRISEIDENLCIGCTKCSMVCSTDAIVGAPKMIHTVFSDNCHGCGKCVDVCPVMAIKMQKVKQTVDTWHWAKPIIKQEKPEPVIKEKPHCQVKIKPLVEIIPIEKDFTNEKRRNMWVYPLSVHSGKQRRACETTTG